MTKILNMAAKKQLSTMPKTKSPLEPDHIIKFLQVANLDCPFQVTFLAAIQIGFMALLRRSNICPPSVSAFDSAKHLCRKDITCDHHGVTVHLRWSKTNQSQDCVHKIPIAASGNPSFDPPAFYRYFAAKFPVHDTDPCFAFYYNSKLHVLIHRDLATMLQSFLHKAGYSPDGITTHSIRRGGATVLMRSGIDMPAIQHHGTWSSDVYKQYLVYNEHDKLKVTRSVYKYLKL